MKIIIKKIRRVRGRKNPMDEVEFAIKTILKPSFNIIFYLNTFIFL